jgi:class 3 adenylate cyclase
VKLRRRAARVLAGLAFACAAAGALAQATLDAGTERIHLWPQVRVLSDAHGTLTAEEAYALRERFTAPRGAYASLGMGTDVLWLRIPVAVAEGGAGRWVLDIDYALLRRIDVYLADGGRVTPIATLGNSQPFASRPLKARSNAAPLDLAPGHTVDLLLRIDTPGARILPITLNRPAAFLARALAEQTLQALLACVGLLLLAYSLLQWATLREGLYLKYALVVLFNTMYSVHFFGVGEMYLWTDVAWFERHMAGVTALMAAASTSLFVTDVLGRELRPSLSRVLRGLAAFHIACAVAHGLDLISIHAVGIVMTATGLAPGLVGVPDALRIARRGQTIGAWLIASWLGFLVTGGVMIGVVLGVIRANAWTLHSFQIGVTLDMLIFMRIALLRTATLKLERERLRQSFAGYVGPAILEEIVSGRLAPEPGGEQRYVCVLFSDMRGYTAMSEGRKPTEMLAFLNRYFDGVVAIVHAHGGTVICFMGDGIMVAFGAPQPLANPCDAAWRAARAMLGHLGVVNRQLAAEGREPIEIGIGLHAGVAVVGHVGSRQRHEYAAIGDVTNVAARLEGATKDAGYRIVMSEEVALRLEARAGLVPLGPVTLKGHTPVEAHGFDPTSPGSSARAAAEVSMSA